MKSDFERTMRELTRPINGQYPRPWMTNLQDPLQARVFIVGKNQAKTYPEELVRSHDRYLDSLFNRRGESCRRLYNEITRGAPSPTRRNIDALTRRLEGVGVPEVLETNVVCYSSPMSGDLSRPEHRGGTERGTAIFAALLRWIDPPVLIANGKGTRRQLAKVLGSPLPDCPSQASPLASEKVTSRLGRFQVFVIPSLSPPEYNKWQRWADEHLDRVTAEVADHLGRA